MPTEEATWTVDICTCKHPVTAHKDGSGSCEGCADAKFWGRPSAGCMRYQWNGEPRRRTW